jgi:hypothetical protein
LIFSSLFLTIAASESRRIPYQVLKVWERSATIIYISTTSVEQPTLSFSLRFRHWQQLRLLERPGPVKNSPAYKRLSNSLGALEARASPIWSAGPRPVPSTNLCPADSTGDEYKKRSERMEYIQSPRHFAVIKTGPARSGVRRLVAALRLPILPHTGRLPPGFAATPMLPSRVLRGPCSRAASRPVWRLTEAEQAATSRRTPERAAAT